MDDHLKTENKPRENQDQDIEKTLEAFKAYFKTPEHFKKEVDTRFDRITRKDFLEAIKKKSTYATINDRNEEVKHTMTDSVRGAIGFLISLGNMNYLLLAIELMETENAKQEAREYLTNAIERKAREISRQRNKKQKTTPGKQNKLKLPFYTSPLNTLIPSVTKKDYTETDEQGRLVAAGVRNDLIKILAKEVEGRIDTLDANAGMIYMMFVNKLINRLRDKGLNADEKRTVTLSTAEYKELRGMKNDGEAIKKLTYASYAFACFMALIKVPLSDNAEDYEITTVIMTKKVRFYRGVLTIVFEPDFIEAIQHGYISELPKEIFRINLQKAPNAFYIAKYLCWFSGYNGKKHHKNNAAKYMISVESVLKECRTIPKYDDIKETGQVYDRIINPFISSLKILSDKDEDGKPQENGFINYEFTHAKGQPLAPGELEALESGRMSYSDFRKLYISYTIIDSETKELIEL